MTDDMLLATNLAMALPNVWAMVYAADQFSVLDLQVRMRGMACS